MSQRSRAPRECSFEGERALDALLEREARKRSSTQAPRKLRKLKPGSRHVPRSVQRAVWERDGHRKRSLVSPALESVRCDPGPVAFIATRLAHRREVTRWGAPVRGTE